MNSKRFDGIDHPVREVRDLRDLINSSCAMFPDVDAYLYKDKAAGEFKGVKYSQVKADMDALGTRFLDMGLKDKKIAVIGETSYYWFLTYYATVCGTGVIVPLDKNLPPEEVKTLVHRSKANAIVYSKKMEKSVKPLFDDPCELDYFISMDEPRHRGLAADSDPANDQGASGAAANRILSLRELIAEGADLVHQGERGFIDAEIDPNQMATLIFTSGTTGKAKGVMLSHKNIASNVVNMSRREKLGDNFVVLSILPTHHTFENTCVDWTTFYQGKTLAICEGIKYISKNMNEVHANCMVGVPLVFEKIYKGMMKQADSTGQGEKLRNAIRLSRRLKLYNNPPIVKRMFKAIHEALGGEMQQFIAGGAAIDPQVILDFEAMGIPMMQGYGMTECSPIIAVNQNNYSIAESVGRPMHGTTVRIDNPDSEGVGEIVCKGPSVMLGYYEDPEATEEVLRDGWLYTGDLGYMDENGFLYVTGRKKTVIVTKGGKNIFPEEIEEVLKQNDLVKEVLVHGVTDKRIGNVAVTADIQPNFALLKERYGEMDQSEIYHFYKELVDKVNDTMPAYKAIKRVNIREKDFEMTTTGKLKRYGNFVEGEESTGSLSYKEIKDEEQKRAQEFAKEIADNFDFDVHPITDIRDILRMASEAFPDDIVFDELTYNNLLTEGNGTDAGVKGTTDRKHPGDVNGTDATLKETTYKNLFADVNGLGTALINRGFRGKKIKIKCGSGTSAMPSDYNSLVLMLAVACGVGTAVLTDEKPEASIEELVAEGKTQMAQGDRQYIDSEIAGTDVALEVGGIPFTHSNIAEALMAMAPLLSEVSDVALDIRGAGAPNTRTAAGASNTTTDTAAVTPNTTTDTAAAVTSKTTTAAGAPNSTTDTATISTAACAPNSTTSAAAPNTTNNTKVTMAEFLIKRLLPLYLGKTITVRTEPSNDSSSHSATAQPATEKRTTAKEKIIVYIVPECASPVALTRVPNSGIRLETVTSLFSKNARKQKRAIAEGAVGNVVPGLGIRFVDVDLSGNGEIYLAGGVLSESDANAAPTTITASDANTAPSTTTVSDANTAPSTTKWKDGWFHTGDLGHLDEDGYLYITGKVSDRFVGDKRSK